MYSNRFQYLNIDIDTWYFEHTLQDVEHTSYYFEHTSQGNEHTSQNFEHTPQDYRIFITRFSLCIPRL